MVKRRTWITAALALALFAFNVWLNAPLFENGEQPYRGSIESGYAGIARFFAAHPNPYGWNPFIYCGISTQHTYLPGMPYVTALVLWLNPGMEALHAYRIVTALFASFGPVTLFLFAAYAAGSRGWAFAAALGYTLCSPAYDLFQTIDSDRGLLPVPWRLHVMVKYGEGPHNMGLTLLPLALLAVWAAAKSTGFRKVFLAAVALAAVALTHWIAALALAFCCLLLFAAQWGAGAEFRHMRVVLAGLLGYALACFWLTPTFVQTVGFNWPRDSFGYQLARQEHIALALIAAGLLAILLLFRKYPAYRYLSFVTACFFLFAALAEAHYAHKVDAIPEARRYTVEMELFLALALAEWMRVGWNAGGGVNRFCVAMTGCLLAVSGTPQAAKYLRDGYDSWKLRPKEYTVEYRLADWLRKRSPSGRVYVSGGLRFRLNSWFDVTQTNGTFDSGLLTRTPLELDYRFRSLTGIRKGMEQKDSLLMLQAMGVEYVVVHGEKSEEYYRDVKQPQRLDALFPVVYGDGPDRVFQVPFRGLAFFRRHNEAPASWQPAYLESYLPHAVEAGGGLLTDWDGTGKLRIRGGMIPEDSGISVIMTYDPGWRATHKGNAIPVEKDAMGFLYLRPPVASEPDIVLEYGMSWEKRLTLAVSAAAWVLSVIACMNRHGGPGTGSHAVASNMSEG
ncbi:MAG: hypothetical protein U0R19_20345 [Bryobacteraceae bacterium]